MSTFVVDAKVVRIPDWVENLKSFRRWVHSDQFPSDGRICYLKGEVWVDMTKEQFVHNQIKGEIGSVLTRLVKQFRLGRYFPDGYLLTNEAADLSTNPDGMFVLAESLRMQRVRLVPGADEGFVELEGTPDMVLEVISPNTGEKDQVTMRELYWKAGIAEYWLVDPWRKRLEFQILRHSSRDYAAVRKQAGWIKSGVFGKSFRLIQEADDQGLPDFTLDVR